MNLIEKHHNLIEEASKALLARNYYSPYPESPKAYPEDAESKGLHYFSTLMNHNFTELIQTSEEWIGEEISPYLQVGIGIKYPKHAIDTLLQNASQSQKEWAETDVLTRAAILIETLERIRTRFFDIAFATMHTTGQGYMMAFQASGPHSNDRALEAIITGYQELMKVPAQVDWIKPMGKFDLSIHKNWKPVPKGISLVIGCSTFPIWNTVPAVYASLITGNSCIVKPHPKAILPIAIVIAEMQNVLKENNYPPHLIQLAADTTKSPITKELAENTAIKLVDFTGSSSFGSYIESLPKTVFTEKAGVNCLIIDTVKDITPVLQNIALSVSLYSGQMCTAPQNIFIPKNGIKTETGNMSYEETIQALVAAVNGLATHPKAGAPTIGAIQSDLTFNRIQDAKSLGGKIILESQAIVNPDFKDARIATPVIIELDRDQHHVFNNECFGPIIFVIKTNDTLDSVNLAKSLAIEKGALTCGVYCTDKTLCKNIESEMNSVYVPVSFNFTGAALINSHAAFSDFHVTGGNAAGNASLTTSEFIVKRFVWVGNRYA